MSEFLPGNLVTGAGVGLVIPTLTGAGASSLPANRFATGAAVLTMGRQIGAALGVALLVAVLGNGGASAADFHSAWMITVISGLATGAAMFAIGPRSASVSAVDPVIALDPVDVAEMPAESLIEEAA